MVKLRQKRQSWICGSSGFHGVSVKFVGKD
jgi:hypothetical protein